MSVAIISEAQVPAPGQPAAALDTAVPGARFTKRAGYHAVSLAVADTTMFSGSFAIFRYWPEPKQWLPEGQRGVTPATFDNTVANSIPIRVSMPRDEEVSLCVVRIGSGTGTPTAYLREETR